MTRFAAVAAMIALAACSGSIDRPPDAASTIDESPAAAVSATSTSAPISTTTSTSTSTSTSASSTTRPSSTTIESTTAASTTIASMAPTSVDPTCVPESEIVTASGRRITLRADGLVGPSPVILVIHGYTGTPTGIERVADLTAFGNANGIAVAYPHGTPTDVGGLAWDTGALVLANTGVDDAAAIDEMLAAIEATGCVDGDRIVITGESNGGAMVLAALCDPRLEGRFRSAVMVIPAVDDGVLQRCGDDVEATTPLIAVAGRIDATAPFDGGNGLLSQLDWFDRVATARGCSATGAAEPITSFADDYVATGCASCTELIAVSDGPHTWPGSAEGTADLAAGTFDLNRRLVDDLLAAEPGCLSTR